MPQEQRGVLEPADFLGAVHAVTGGQFRRASDSRPLTDARVPSRAHCQPRGAGLKVAAWWWSSSLSQLVGSHSHEMAVGAMALAVILVAQQFSYATLHGTARAQSRIGMALVAIGTVVMMGMYLAGGFSTWAPPAWFVSGLSGANGIALDDMITGILVMGGGLLIVVALVLGRTSLMRQPLRLAALWSWVAELLHRGRGGLRH
jgi:hypothetical protein